MIESHIFIFRTSISSFFTVGIIFKVPLIKCIVWIFSVLIQIQIAFSYV